MAARKPAKVNAGNPKTSIDQRPGKPIKVISMSGKSNAFECPTCKTRITKGILYEHNNLIFCKRNCIPVDKKESE